ncbi:deoxycytidyl transferase [Arachnomyces sp. PD_36]|nr:deoxycytidyl transferase [Arachnomyces sp. PD_36]
MGSRLESNSNAVRKRIENHTFEDEEGEEYGASAFGGFGDYFRRKKLKLQNLDAEIRSSSPDKPPIFRGVVAHVNGYTQPSLNDIHRLIVSHGGGFLQYLDGKTAATHIIASNLTPKKRAEFRKYRIVKPAWVVESVKSGTLLPWDSFRLVDEGSSQKVLGFENGAFTSQANRVRDSYRSQSDNSWYSSQLKNNGGLKEKSPQAGDYSSNPDNEAPDPQITSAASNDISTPETLLNPSNSIEAESATFLDSTDGVKDASASARLTPEGEVDTEQDPTRELSLDKEPIPGSADMTPEEYNSKLLSDPRMRNSSVVNPEFLQQFYRESRLHHLSTWKAELKAKFQASAREKSFPQSQRKLTPGSRRYILHVDFDSFFAAVSLQKHPDLIDKPVAVAHGKGSGSEIASCNYPARAFGVKNGMWMKGALQMCPELKVLPYDFDAYEDASRKFYDAILAIDGTVQSVSIDEALLDVSFQCIDAGGSDGKAISEGSIYREQFKADEIAQGLRDSIKESTGCAVSVGIGGNILQAKLALRKAKPAGQFQLKPDQVLDFIGGLTVKDLPGVAHSLGRKLEELGVTFVKDIRDLTRERLTSALGPKTGVKLWEYARGIDRTEVGDQVIRKSVSAEINWGIRFVTQAQAEEFVQSLCEELHRRLVENGVKGKQLTMRIMRRSADAPLEPVKHLGHGKCDTFNRSVMLGVATNSSDIIGKEAVSMLKGFGFSPGDLRGLGVQMTKLEPVAPLSSHGLESSQKQLEFKASSARSPNKVKKVDPDDVNSPRKGDGSSPFISQSLRTRPSLNDKSLKPLNLMGTQFIMPSQPDPEVLAELPGDIRTKLAAQGKGNSGRAKSPNDASPFTGTALPPQSQLDKETLEALPEDVRAEVLAFYRQSPQLPQQLSPSRTSQPSKVKKVTTPTKKRGRGRPPASKPAGISSLARSNFAVNQAGSVSNDPSREATTSPPPDLPEGVSAEFLDALPEDIRREVLEEHRRSRPQQRASLNPPSNNIRRPPPVRQSVGELPPGQKRLRLPPAPEKPTFTSRKLSSLPDLREAMSAWYNSFETEGPYDEDVDALVVYLRRVVLEERDIEKAASVAEWLKWLIDEGAEKAALAKAERDVSQGQASGSESPDAIGNTVHPDWNKAIQAVRDGIDAAARKRGLSPVEFSWM